MKFVEHHLDEDIKERKNLQRKYKKLLTETIDEFDSLVKLMISKSNKDNKLLTGQEFEKQKLDLSYKRDDIREQLKDLNKRQDHIINEVRTNLEFCTNLINRFNNGSIDDKREILINLGRTVDLRYKILSIKPEVPFKSMQKVKKFTTTYPKWVELNPSLDNNENEALVTVSRLWREARSLIRTLVLSINLPKISYNYKPSIIYHS